MRHRRGADADGLGAADRDAYRVAHARATARLMRRLGWVSLALGFLGLVATAAMLAVGAMDLEKAVLTATSTALVSLLSGAAVYGGGMNVTINASLLERNVAESAGSSVPRGEDQ